MSLRPNTVITISQQANDVYPSGRDKVFTLDFCNAVEINSSWTNLTDTAKIKIPRNIYVDDGTENFFNIGSDPNRSGKNIYGGDSSSPLFMRGDKIEISLGYFYDNMDGTPETLLMDTDSIERGAIGSKVVTPGQPTFIGYISKIKNHIPIEIECEDQMWKLKQIRCPNKIFKGSQYTVQQMIAELLNGDKHNFSSPYKIVDGTDQSIKTNIGDFRVQNETVAQVLDRLKKDGGIYSFFRGENEIRVSGIVYYPQDRNEEIFNFQDQQNPGEGIIISDQLEYTRKEDLNIAIKAHAEFLSRDEGGDANLDNSPKTKRLRIEIMVGKIDNSHFGKFTKTEEESFKGEVHTLPIPIPSSIGFVPDNISDNQQAIALKKNVEKYMTQKAIEYLTKLYYTGFRGSVLTFGQPVIRHGDAMVLQNKVLPEQDGKYLIKQVTTTQGMQGYRQKAMLHLRIDKGFTIDQLNSGVLGVV